MSTTILKPDYLSQCAGKLRYTTLAQAHRCLRRMRKRQRQDHQGRMGVYRCPFDPEHFHIGHHRRNA